MPLPLPCAYCWLGLLLCLQEGGFELVGYWEALPPSADPQACRPCLHSLERNGKDRRKNQGPGRLFLHVEPQWGPGPVYRGEGSGFRGCWRSCGAALTLVGVGLASCWL